jgi:hypothetical protein
VQFPSKIGLRADFFRPFSPPARKRGARFLQAELQVGKPVKQASGKWAVQFMAADRLNLGCHAAKRQRSFLFAVVDAVGGDLTVACPATLAT